MYYLGDRDRIGLGFDLSSGGAISSLRYKKIEMVDASDMGREIQVALWDSGDTYKDPFKGRYGWNPIQAGDIYGNGAKVLDADLSPDYVYIKARGKQYGKNDVDADVMFTTEAWDRGSYFEVHINAEHIGSDHHATSLQELPSVHASTTLNYRARYVGNAPFKGKPIELLGGKPACTRKTIVHPTEHWLGFARRDGVGLIVVVPPDQHDFVAWQQCFPWRGGYLSPWANFDMPPGAIREIQFFLIPGSVYETRLLANQLVGPG